VNVTNPMSITIKINANLATNVTFAKSKDPTNASLARSVPKLVHLKIP
jgi:hypothetical protein